MMPPLAKRQRLCKVGVEVEQKIGKHIDRGASLMDYIKDEQPAGPNAKGSNKDLSPEAINESIGKEIASKSGFGG